MCNPHAPVRASEDRDSTRDRIRLARIRLDPKPARELDAQQVIHNLEPLLALGEVDRRDAHDALELALRVVAQEREDGAHARRADVQRELVLEHRELLDVLREALEEVRAVRVQRLGRRCVAGHGGVRRRRLGERGLGCCVVVCVQYIDSLTARDLAYVPLATRELCRARVACAADTAAQRTGVFLASRPVVLSANRIDMGVRGEEEFYATVNSAQRLNYFQKPLWLQLSSTLTFDSTLPSVSLAMSVKQDASSEQPPAIFDSLPYYDNDLERYPILREKVEKELAREARPQGIHPKVPPPPKLFAVSPFSVPLSENRCPELPHSRIVLCWKLNLRGSKHTSRSLS